MPMIMAINEMSFLITSCLVKFSLKLFPISLYITFLDNSKVMLSVRVIFEIKLIKFLYLAYNFCFCRPIQSVNSASHKDFTTAEALSELVI